MIAGAFIEVIDAFCLPIDRYDGKAANLFFSLYLSALIISSLIFPRFCEPLAEEREFFEFLD